MLTKTWSNRDRAPVFCLSAGALVFKEECDDIGTPDMWYVTRLGHSFGGFVVGIKDRFAGSEGRFGELKADTVYISRTAVGSG